MGGTVPAVCYPSRAMLLSGRSLFHLKQGAKVRYKNTFPRVMRKAGYETYHHGKYGNGPRGIYKDFEQEWYLSNDTEERLAGRPGQEIADAAIAFFKNRDTKRPFFAYLAPGSPHTPHHAPRDWIERYKGRFDHG